MRKQNIVFMVSFLFAINSCTCKSEKKRIEKDGFILEGRIDKDSGLDGVINYYNNKNLLLSTTTFANNIKNGLSINYYPNGKIKDKVWYFFGKQNGNHTVYDSLGSIIYTDYFYYGKQIGPVCFYKSDSSLSEYYFLNFEGETLFYYSYSNNQVQKDPNDYFHMNISDVLQDGIKKKQLFIYILQIPEFSINYEICKEDKMKKLSSYMDIPESQVFYQTYLMPLKDGDNYCISVTEYDSITKSKKTIIKKIL